MAGVWLRSGLVAALLLCARPVHARGEATLGCVGIQHEGTRYMNMWLFTMPRNPPRYMIFTHLKSMEICPAGGRIFTGKYDLEVRWWDTESDPGMREGLGPYGVTFRARRGHEYVVLPSEDDRLMLLDTKTQKRWYFSER